MGVLRAVSGNLPHVHQRIVSHRGSLAKILSMGMSRRHRANPIAALRAENIFATPILFSGMASLFITKAESDILALHVKETTENLLKLHSKTPDPVVFFLAGRLPGEALLHLKQLTLFGMICHLPGNILHTIAIQLLTTSSQSSRNSSSRNPSASMLSRTSSRPISRTSGKQNCVLTVPLLRKSH